MKSNKITPKVISNVWDSDYHDDEEVNEDDEPHVKNIKRFIFSYNPLLIVLLPKHEVDGDGMSNLGP